MDADVRHYLRIGGSGLLATRIRGFHSFGDFPDFLYFGGDYEMRGFYPGRLFDRSAAVATFRYRWPIAIWLDGSIHASVGNVFGEHLRDFDTKLLRFSGTLGISSRNSAEGSIEALIGFGTETFEHGVQIDSIRLLVGTNRGF